MFDDELANSFRLWELELEEDHNKFWNGLSKDDQLKAFCSVMRLLYKAELEEHGSYRYTLYDVFGFGRRVMCKHKLVAFYQYTMLSGTANDYTA